MRMCLTLAVAFVSGAVVSFLIAEFGRAADDRRKKADELNQKKSDDASERRRLVGELREVHHAVTTAKLRIQAHKTVRSYGDEIRDVIIPKISQLGGVISDVDRHRGELFETTDARNISEQAGIVRSYLEELTNEYRDRYLSASLVQEADYKWRQYRVSELVKDDRFSKAPPTEDELPVAAKTESSAWYYLQSKDEGDRYRFPRLLIFLEAQEAEAAASLNEQEKMLHSHKTGFSDPIRRAMNRIDQSGRPQSQWRAVLYQNFR
jgi:hypothetical protein